MSALTIVALQPRTCSEFTLSALRVIPLARAANDRFPPTAALCSLRCYVVNGRTPDDRLMAPRVGLGPQSDLGINLQPISRASDLVAKQPKLSASGALDSAISVDEFAPPD